MDLERAAGHPGGICGDWKTRDHVIHLPVTQEKGLAQRGREFAQGCESLRGVGGVAGSHAGETPGGRPASGSLLQVTLD